MLVLRQALVHLLDGALQFAQVATHVAQFGAQTVDPAVDPVAQIFAHTVGPAVDSVYQLGAQTVNPVADCLVGISPLGRYFLDLGRYFLDSACSFANGRLTIAVNAPATVTSATTAADTPGQQTRQLPSSREW